MDPRHKNREDLKIFSVFELQERMRRELRTPDLTVEECLYLSGVEVTKPFNDYSYKDIINAYRAGYENGRQDQCGDCCGGEH